jgi:hypothetical protein
LAFHRTRRKKLAVAECFQTLGADAFLKYALYFLLTIPAHRRFWRLDLFSAIEGCRLRGACWRFLG